jgi:hypothetical protein
MSDCQMPFSGNIGALIGEFSLKYRGIIRDFIYQNIGEICNTLEGPCQSFCSEIGDLFHYQLTAQRVQNE